LPAQRPVSLPRRGSQTPLERSHYVHWSDLTTCIGGFYLGAARLDSAASYD
jgi:hypothetical protein